MLLKNIKPCLEIHSAVWISLEAGGKETTTFVRYTLSEDDNLKKVTVIDGNSEKGGGGTIFVHWMIYVSFYRGPVQDLTTPITHNSLELIHVFWVQ